MSEHDVEELFKEGISLRDQGNYPEAVKIFELILSQGYERRAPVLGVLGHVYFLMNDFVNAERCYSEVVRLSPRSELASLGYFHTLWAMGRGRDAYDEAKRFLSGNKSEEYTALVSGIRDSLKDDL